VASEDDVRRLYDTVMAAHGRVDIAFHNAGISPPDDDSILDTGLEVWLRVHQVNLSWSRRPEGPGRLSRPPTRIAGWPRPPASARATGR
jgi:NAD(P)-dependent dehydrogenase (short-subunit alcohol dehydrogenase family)